MSATRTPPKECSGSAPDLSDIRLIESTPPMYVTTRQDFKRKYGDVFEEEVKTFMADMKKMFSSAAEAQNHKFNTLHSSIEEIKQQNSGITQSMEFMSAKYDEVLAKLEHSEKERKKHLEYITVLENRVEQLERVARKSSIEIRNIPKHDHEHKEDLIKIVKNIGMSINVEIHDTDVKDIFRYNSKSSTKMPIVVEFSTVIKKEILLDTVKKLKQESKTYLSTTHAKIDGPKEPIYISESLTAEIKKLFARARTFANDNNYKYCWTSHGFVYLRKEEGAKAIRLSKEEDLNKLTPTK